MSKRGTKRPALRLPKNMVESLHVLGFERIGELAAKPRAPLALRFGPELGRRLDQAMGRLSEPIEPVRPPDLIEVRRVFADPIGATETIARYTGKLVGQLCEALEAKGLGAGVSIYSFTGSTTVSRPSASARPCRCAT